jgi:hypothetical protein
MTTTETRTVVEAPPCKRCHGTGLEPRHELAAGKVETEEQRQLLERMVELGNRRAETNRHTLVGRQILDDIYHEVRVQAAEAERIGLQRVQMMKAFGVSRAAFYNILSGKTGTS